MNNRYYKAHPWHGISYGEKCPSEVIVFIEIVPMDTIKYEIDKISGYLMIDRPQKFSNVTPSLYGFIPKTYCGDKIANLARSTGLSYIKSGDHDPLDIIVLTSHQVFHGNILLNAIPIGGFCMMDKYEGDDKIISVLVNDHIYGNIKDISELPIEIISRLKHYFLTYKSEPEENIKSIFIEKLYGAEHAKEVIKASIEDYNNYIKSVK